MEDKELSQWFDINVQKPWEPGVYEVQRKGYDYSGQFSLFKNGIFHEVGLCVPNSAIKWAEIFGVGDGSDVIKWRGLALNPASTAKPKTKGNRKVTRYVCVYGIFNNPCAVFNTKKEAEKHVNSGKSWGYTKIRFRTPEA